MSARLAVLASGAGSNALAIARACDDGRIAGRVAVVLSNRPQAPVLAASASRGLVTRVVDHRRFESRDAFDAALIEALAPFEPELVALAGFMRVLTPRFLRPYRGRLINIHPSLLPRFPGLDTHARVLAAGDPETGATVHYVTEALDAGPAIVQGRLRVRADDDVASLAARVQALEHRIYPLALGACVAGRVALDAGGATLDGKPLPPAGADPGALSAQARGSVTPR